MLRTVLSRFRNLLLYGHYIPVDYFIFEERRIVYISIPKVACTSIKTALMGGTSTHEGSYNRYMSIHHDARARQYAQLPMRARGYFKFAFVRNPLDRLVSCYEDKLRRPVQHTGRYYFDTAYNRRLLAGLFGKSFTVDMSFEEFALLVTRIPDWLADAHFKSQTSMLFQRGRPTPDYIGHFETLEKDWESIASRFGLERIERKNTSPERDWHSYYRDRAILEAVTNRYRKDLENLGYESEYQRLLDEG